MKLIYLLVITMSILGCNSKSENQKSIERSDCIIFYKKFKEEVIKGQKKNALIAIDKAINCDPNNESFKSNKLRFLIELSKYNDAIKLIDSYKSDDNSFKMLTAVLKFKNKDAKAIDLLRECYNRYKDEREITTDDLIYKIALTNFFDGKEKALKEIDISRTNSKEENVKINLETLEELINQYDKQNVLFKLYGISESEVSNM